MLASRFHNGACMNRIEANEFAAKWISAWNRKDVNAVLEHYVEDANWEWPLSLSGRIYAPEPKTLPSQPNREECHENPIRSCTGDARGHGVWRCRHPGSSCPG